MKDFLSINMKSLTSVYGPVGTRN